MSSMDMMCLPITPNHIRLIIACYPAAPLAAGPDFRPNSQELSRLTYYASNRPGKLHKLSNELEKRAKAQARKAQGGHAKSRALLLVTLDILKSLTAECRRDLSLFSDAVLASVEATLVCSTSDLELVARAASLFTAWTTYTDGSLVGVDNTLTRSYFGILGKFAKMSTSEGGDEDTRNRTQLLGLAVLSSSLQSDALSNSVNIYEQQVNIIVPALLKSITQAGLSLLSAEATAVETYSGQMSPAPYMTEFQPQKPIAERRARSIHIHIDGEKGPTFSDVLNASLRALKALLSLSNALQVPLVLESAFQAFDAMEGKGGWNDTELCCWLVSKATAWTQYQYRYSIPSRLLQKLVDSRDTPTPTPLHFAVTSMIATIFTSSTPLINLSTSDILTNLANVIMSRLTIDPVDTLTRPLVDCTASLGTHIYYTDQIQDLAEEIVSRIVKIQIGGLLGRGRNTDERSREEGLRCLLACLDGLIRVAEKHHPEPHPVGGATISSILAEKLLPSSTAADTRDPSELPINANPPGHHGRRSRVAVDVWHDTVALLCEAEYSIRNDYSLALVNFISNEIHKEPFAITLKNQSITANSDDQSNRFSTAQPEKLMISDPTLRFLHALHAAAFTLAVTPTLGLNANTPPASHSPSTIGLVPPAAINIIAPTPEGTPRKEEPPTIVTEPPHSATESSSSQPTDHTPISASRSSTNLTRKQTTIAPARLRSVSVGLKRVEIPPTTVEGAAPAPATPSDYSHLLRVLAAVHENLPTRGLLTGVPMLIALANAARLGAESSDSDFVALQRKLAINELVCKTWLVIANVWCSSELETIAREALARLSSTSSLPSLDVDGGNQYPARAEPSLFLTTPENFVMPSLQPTDGIDSLKAIETLAKNANVQKALSLGPDMILQRLSEPWSTEIAIEESVEKVGLPEHHRESTSHFLKISPGLMSGDNKSLQSLARTARGVGVGDLREALEGRGSMSNPALASAAQSMQTSTDNHRSTISNLQALALSRTRSRPQDTNTQTRKVSKSSPKEVRDVLNRLGVGRQTGSTLLHAPFPSGLQPKRDENSTSILVPPYK